MMQSHRIYHFCAHSVLMSFADECCATLARLIAYVGALALFAIVGLYVWEQLQFDMAAEAADRPGFTLADRSHPAFAVGSLDLLEKSVAYDIFRHPEGGRKDVFHWSAPGEKPMAELEIYRAGAEFDLSTPASAGLTERMGFENRQGLEPAGVIASKFGTVALFRRPGRVDAATPCLGFAKRLDDSALQISGWSCQGATLVARRAAIGCMLDRLTLLTSGNEPRLAELFARADLRRSGCGAASAVAADWVTGGENPRLRGQL
jgi:hypothetical protein